MALRLLLGLLAPGPPDQESNLETVENDTNFFVKELKDGNFIPDFKPPAKLHIGMLTISLLIGLAFGGFISYTCWMKKSKFSSYIRDLVIVLVCRTFFSIILDGVVLLGTTTVGGANALLAFEQICMNLTFAFWLTLTIYLHALVQRNFNSEPTLNIYRYGVPGVALFFAFVWIFLLQDTVPQYVWWFFRSPFTQWIVNSFNLLCLLIQLALLGDIIKMLQKASFDNDTTSLLKKILILLGVCVFIFWLHLGLLIGWVPVKCSSSYTHFFYFVDGIHCASVCVVLYFFNDRVPFLLNTTFLNEETPSNSTEPPKTELLAGTGGRGVVTIDSVFMTDESGRCKNSGSGDVVYSNVVESERLKNIFDLYKRFNKIPNEKVTVVEGEEFYDCLFDPKGSKQPRRSISNEIKKKVSSEESFKGKSNKLSDQTQKKNAFYSSKYLILDSKRDIPKYLETQPGGGSPKDPLTPTDGLSDVNSQGREELVRKWLSDNSEDMPKKDEKIEENSWEKKISESESSKHKSDLETANAQDTSKQTDNPVSIPRQVLSKFNSILWPAFPDKQSRANVTATNSVSLDETAKKNLNLKVSPEIIAIRREAKRVETNEGKLNTEIESLMSDALAVSSTKQRKLPSKQEKETIQEKTPIRSPIPEPKVEDEAKHLDKCLTLSELQEYRLRRGSGTTESQTGMRKNIFSLPETVSSMMDMLTNRRGSSVSQTAEEKLPKVPKSENLQEDELKSAKTDLAEVQSVKTKPKIEVEYEEQSSKSNITRQAKEIVPRGTAVPTSEPPTRRGEPPIDAVTIRPKTIEGGTPVPARFSSDSEFSIEKTGKDNEIRVPVLESRTLSHATTDTRLEENQTDLEGMSSVSDISLGKSSSASSGSFSIEEYYRSVLSAKEKFSNSTKSKI